MGIFREVSNISPDLLQLSQHRKREAAA